MLVLVLLLLVVMQVLLLIDSKSLWVFFFIAALCSVDNLNLWEEQEDRLMAVVDVASKLPGFFFFDSSLGLFVRDLFTPKFN